MLARYQHALAESIDRELRYAALADALQDQVHMLQQELREAKAAQAATDETKAATAPGASAG